MIAARLSPTKLRARPVSASIDILRTAVIPPEPPKAMRSGSRSILKPDRQTLEHARRYDQAENDIQRGIGMSLIEGAVV
jgi:hypothetical protein